MIRCHDDLMFARETVCPQSPGTARGVTMAATPVLAYAACGNLSVPARISARRLHRVQMQMVVTDEPLLGGSFVLRPACTPCDWDWQECLPGQR